MFQRAVHLDPSDSHSWKNLGLVRIMQDRLEDAEQPLRAALAADPRFDEAKSILHLVLESRKPIEAEKKLQKVLVVIFSFFFQYLLYSCIPQ